MGRLWEKLKPFAATVIKGILLSIGMAIGSFLVTYILNLSRWIQMEFNEQLVISLLIALITIIVAFGLLALRAQRYYERQIKLLNSQVQEMKLSTGQKKAYLVIESTGKELIPDDPNLILQHNLREGSQVRVTMKGNSKFKVSVRNIDFQFILMALRAGGHRSEEFDDALIEWELYCDPSWERTFITHFSGTWFFAALLPKGQEKVRVDIKIEEFVPVIES